MRTLLMTALLLVGVSTVGQAQILEERIAKCDKGDVGGCRDAGAQLEQRGDYDRAAGYHRQACDGNLGVACASLARLIANASMGRPDPTRAAALYQRGCDLEYAEACTTLGSWYERGTPVPSDLPRAARLYRRGCDIGD